MKILICGLSCSGKTTLAKKIHNILEWPWFNADTIRKEYNDWDFSMDGRIRQAKRMKILCDNYENTICDFIAPTNEIRKIFCADYTIWMNTTTKSNYSDTDEIFEKPLCDLIIYNFNYNHNEIINLIKEKKYV